MQTSQPYISILILLAMSAKTDDALRQKIQDMLALLRFVENPRDRVAGFRLLHLLPGIGSATTTFVFRIGGRSPGGPWKWSFFGA